MTSPKIIGLKAKIREAAQSISDPVERKAFLWKLSTIMSDAGATVSDHTSFGYDCNCPPYPTFMAGYNTLANGLEEISLELSTE